MMEFDYEAASRLMLSKIDEASIEQIITALEWYNIARAMDSNTR